MTLVARPWKLVKPGGMVTEPGKPLVDGRLLGGPRTYSENSHDWSASKSVFNEIRWVENKGKGKGKGKSKVESKGKKDEQNTTKVEGWCHNCGKWSHKVANCWHWKEKQVHLTQSAAASATASSSSSQISVMKTDDGAKEIASVEEVIAFVEKVQKDTEEGWLFMIAEAMTVNQSSWNGAHSLVVDSGAYAHVCPKSYASHTPLQALPECWRRLDLRSVSGKRPKVR